MRRRPHCGGTEGKREKLQYRSMDLMHTVSHPLAVRLPLNQGAHKHYGVSIGERLVFGQHLNGHLVDTKVSLRE